MTTGRGRQTVAPVTAGETAIFSPQKSAMPTFDYQQLYDDTVKTFVFGDTFKAKAKEIGVTYQDFAKLRRGEAVSVEAIISLLIFHHGIDNIGEGFKNYLNEDK